MLQLWINFWESCPYWLSHRKG